MNLSKKFFEFAFGIGALLAVTGAAAQTSTANLRASVSIASDFVQHGLLQTESGPTIRVTADYEHARGFFAGGALTNVEYQRESDFDNPRDTQATLYVGKSWNRSSWRTNVTLARYLYPDFERDYDYTLLSAGISYRDRYFLTASYSSDYFDIWKRTTNFGAGIALPWIENIEFSASAGRLNYKGRIASSFSHWNVGLTRPFGRFAIDLRFHDTSFEPSTVAGNRTRNQWVFSISRALLPLRQAPGMR